ncbi:integrin beta pat-3-like [Cydia strobilella]|uniref:integrin beta pat-3-like n=1 Tax=Cydia strobilella TaxID=1100964 RepID=UPI003005EFC9
MNKEVLFFVFFGCQLQQVFNDKLQSCKQKNNCHECITDSTMCAWCSADNLKLSDRCQPADSEDARACPAEYSHSPKSNVVVDDKDNLNFSSANQHSIQIKPQRIKMKLRVGEQKKFYFYYKAVENFPVDLYFLLDASNTMKRVRNDISKKSKEIYDAMYNLTTDIQLGYGTFIDKHVFPFQNNMTRKCYSFKHNLNLTSQLEEFQTALSDTIFEKNYDYPESGLDGLAQVMACQNRIQFRKQSRKVIILITDSHSHHAGDGHMAGIIKPYDGECYLNQEGYYTKEKEMDYPSIGMINKLAAEDQFTIIFVVTLEYSKPYQVLADAIPGALVSTYDKRTISEKLNKFYKHISNNILLDVNMLAEDKDKFAITFDPDCSQKYSCKVVLGEELRIDGLIKLKTYYGKDNITVPIVQKGLKEALNLDIQIISRCDCEFLNHSSYQIQSSFCNSAGDLQCGICSCNENRSGPTCACIENNSTSGLSENSTHCFDEDGAECSKNGNCICGGCMCRPGFAGQYCEVRTDNCQRDDTGALCSGHGRCWNGTCECIKGSWEGAKCECSMSKELCMDDHENVCNNRGKCKCEKCKCDPLPKWDVRDYKDKHCGLWCDDCHTRQCLALIDCVACYNQKNSTEDCRVECGNKLAIITDADQSIDNVCVNARVSFGCYANFSYFYNDDEQGIVLYRLSEPNCNEEYYKYGAISLLSALVVGLIIIWGLKLLTDAHDRAEYERFLRTDDDGEAVENLIYKQPTNVFRNPNFKRSFSFR